MNCVVFLVATAIFCQIVSSTPHVRQRRGYTNKDNDYPHTKGGSIVRPSWWSDPSSLTAPDNHKPKGYYDMFGEYHNGNSGEEDFKIKPLPNFGSYGSWREPSTTVPPPSYTNNYSPVKHPAWWNVWSKTTTTPRPPPMQTTQQISTCVSSCPVTAEYNPVCGTNNITYPNPGRLECEQICGVDVRMVKLSACSVSEANGEGNRNREEMVACMRLCPVSDNYSPVCGSNNITYENPQRLKCEQNCGISVKLVKMSPCSEPESKPSVPTDVKIVNPENLITACIKTCPVTGEYNPVCGSNNVTYLNPRRLECAQNCGVAVQLAKLSACFNQNSIPTTPTPTTPKTVNTEEQMTDCVRTCPVTGEYNPVCGSNNVTYLNPGRLECAQNCGVAVQLAKLSACSNQDFIPTTLTPTTPKTVNTEEQVTACIRTCPVTGEYNPVCGTNNVTYFNLARLECAKNCGVVVQLVSYSACVVGESTTSHATVELSSTIGSILSITTSARPYINVNDGNTLNGGNNGHNEDIGNNNNNVNGGNGVNNGNSGNTGNNEYNGSGGSNGSSFDRGESLVNSCDGTNQSHNKNKPPSVQEVTECMQKCSLTSEYNPVCGTDNITYMNPGRLLCSQFCGIDVKVAKFAPCLSFNTIDYHINHCVTTCTNPSVTMTVNHGSIAPTSSLETCMKSCSESPPSLPVCGTNNVTYRNLEMLQCARGCGIDVSLNRIGNCAVPEDEPNSTNTFEPDSISNSVRACINSCPNEQIYQPICGSDNFTYNNTKHLICAKRCGLKVGLKHVSPCYVMLPTTPNPTSATETVPKVTSGKKGSKPYTISPSDQLSIWSEATTPRGYSVIYDIDERY